MPAKDKNKKGVGAPTKMTPDVLKKLEEAFALGCTDIEASLYAGISARTIYNYQEENPEFLQRKEALKEQPVLKARKVVVDALDDGDKDMSRWYLERRKKDEFSTRQESTGADGKDLISGITLGRYSDAKTDTAD
tara:strand:- start:2775 stop:3179 length:405 start_codon:yes stop_codon:yes gene_type:complete